MSHPLSTHAPAAAGPRVQTTAVELRSGLQMLLGEHVRLTVVLMRERIAGVDERTQATVVSVDRNADELSAVIGELYGKDAAASFGQLWAAHVRQLQDYAAGLVDRDEAAKQQARSRLQVTEGDIGRLLSSAVQAALTPEQVEDAIRMHVDTLLAQADAYAAKDWTRAYEVGRECFSHMLMTADVLAGPIAASQGLPVTELQAPRRLLQSALSRLLAEHMGLMVEAMRAAADRAPELQAATTTLNANTSELATAMRALYGDIAARRFLQVWAGHVEGLVAYATATAGGDEGARSSSGEALDRFAGEIGAFLSTATDGRLPAAELTAAVTAHDRDLTSLTDAWAAKDFSRAQELSASGYRHMFTLAETLAEAVGDEVAAGLPRGGAQTGGGGTVGES
ncbi:MAG: hypothetical protein JWN08_1738 [Frankiales bacterium]|nr:hypothetical protein [Frankiales bacterium]